jgi:WD40 repeat protein
MLLQKIHACTGHRAAVYGLAPGQTPRHWLSAAGDGWVAEWSMDNPDTGQLVAQVETPVYTLCSLPGQPWMVAGNSGGGLHWINRTDPGLTRNIQHHEKGVFDLLAVEEWLFSVGGDGTLTRWSIAQQRSIESIQLSNQSLRTVSWNPQRHQLAVGASDNNLYLLAADTFELQHMLTGAHANSVFATAWSPDGRYLLSGGRDAMLYVRDALDDFKVISVQPAHWFAINSIVFSPDGQYFATGSRDKTLKIWSAHTFELLKVVDVQRGGHVNSVNRLLWLPDGLLSCSDDRSIIFWNIRHDAL